MHINKIKLRDDLAKDVIYMLGIPYPPSLPKREGSEENRIIPD